MSKWNPAQRARVKARTNGKCGYCGEQLEAVFHLDHVRSKFLHRHLGERHPDREENLMAACPSCNMLKGSNTVDQFRSLIGGFYATLRRDSRYRLLLRFERVVEVDAPVQFYFETIQSFETEAA